MYSAYPPLHQCRPPPAKDRGVPLLRNRHSASIPKVGVAFVPFPHPEYPPQKANSNSRRPGGNLISKFQDLILVRKVSFNVWSCALFSLL
jgi:hypothetical protein